jgi:hypothetical protein
VRIVFATNARDDPTRRQPYHLEHALLSPPGDKAAAESMQMAFAASELAIAGVEAFSDFTRLRAAA